jgi:hypothetical protein
VQSWFEKHHLTNQKHHNRGSAISHARGINVVLELAGATIGFHIRKDRKSADFRVFSLEELGAPINLNLALTI